MMKKHRIELEDNINKLVEMNKNDDVTIRKLTFNF